MESALPQLRPEKKQPLYQQLYSFFTAEIKSGRLCAGEKVPSKRRLAEALHISVNTVDTAYQMLVAEGYLRVRARSGYHVCALERLPQTGLPVQTAAQSAFEPRSFAASEALPEARYNFSTSSIDTSLFPFKTWRRLQREILAAHPELLNHGPRQGDANLREAIASYLHEFRGAHCTAEQIVIGAGIEYLLGILARLFCEKGVFAVENPGYARTARVLLNSGARVACVPVDAEGMSLLALAASNASFAYVTPSHQFPTGVTMPVGRRTALLHWANAAPGRYVIEDDYDSEFRFDGKPIPCLQGLDEDGRVIYISTFSKSIAPAIRIGYMVLPPEILRLYRQEFGFYSCTVSRLEQQTLCAFLDGGYFGRHLARMRIAYRQRRDRLLGALQKTLGARLAVSGAHTGLHLLVQVRNGMTETQLLKAAAEHGAQLTGLSAYYREDAQACPVSTVVLGYAGIPPEAVDAAVEALRAAWLNKHATFSE